MPILRGCEDAVLELLEEGAHFVRFGSGASVFERGSMPTGLFFVHSGAVRLMSLCPEGRPKVVEIFEPGGMFGEIGVFTGQRYRTWTQAIGAVVLIHVARERMLEAVAVDNALCNRMLGAVCARTQRLVDAISSTASGTASVRVASYLLEQLGRSPRPDACVVLPAPKKAIASLLNLTPETLSRVLRNMVEEGVITVGGRRIHVRNRPLLAAMLSSGTDGTIT
ncbi:Crp/Fnr family transcriptional regulator [Thauera sp.]|jgi:CRP-like cAMP-binding protein|uniref:Crp/Fnr family transcriptional regulator n=1 Tax=Thauera sp. TaxID=1905334 RepID=UPI002A36BE01|nr:Crp/Fnr family transcriptional regulator [Thauera sp.]MDX9885180.1 Crp/Fnr family transcriptional regulator [Thauera sp.]